ncbi:MAG TPA: BamA/TamA family outer membrane protein [Candidatus Kapabacteria bacterium]|nr:BamA/TamA family outer membrane protein [Candidatus Kapabacteria bacterium]
MRRISSYIFIILLVSFSICNLSAQNETQSNTKQIVNSISHNLVPSTLNKNLYEINIIEFEGIKSFKLEEIIEVIQTQSTVNNTPYRFFKSFYKEFEKNRATPKILLHQFKQGLNILGKDVPFFYKEQIQEDVTSIETFYHINGFHFAKVYYMFYPSKNKQNNILKFVIKEGPQFFIDTIVYQGLGRVDKEVLSNIEKARTVKKDSKFSEAKITLEIQNITNILKNNGYFYASTLQPIVLIDTLSQQDSIIIPLDCGNRYKVGRIDFIDSNRGQPKLAYQVKRKSLELKQGDWVSREKVMESTNNLLSLGTFELVAIDTTSQFAPQNDSILNFASYLFYRKQQEWDAGLSFNQTRIDNLLNFGLEAYYRHRNFLNAAQNFSPFVNIYLKDVSSTISTGIFELEGQIGFRYSQPILWTIANSRVGLSASISYSQRLMNNYFRISTFSFPLSFPIKFPKITYFDIGSIDFQFTRDEPINFASSMNRAYRSAKNAQDTNNIMQAFYLYQSMDDYLSSPTFHLLTSNSIGFSMTGDSRNNVLSPTKGYLTFIGIDGWNPLFFFDPLSGLSRYIRFQISHSQYILLSPTTVFAYKGKFGTITLLQKGNSFIPLNVQFFSGGPNSVRAWPARKLRYAKPLSDSTMSANTIDFLQNFVGNGVIVEGSAEFRFGFKKFPGLSTGLANIISNMGTTLFLDFGNSFHWYLENTDYKISFSDYITKLAVGVGIGLRYQTPIGPIRLDFAFPVYDPLKQITPFSKTQISFGIGNAF